jgi:hypothetical protein
MGALKEIVTSGGTIPLRRDFDVMIEGDEVLLSDMERYFSNAESHERKMISSITNAIMETAQTFSPYLTGTLRAAHRAKMSEGDGQSSPAQGMFSSSPELISRGGAQETGNRKMHVGIVHIDPSAWNAITEGAPYIYGANIHMERNPWFGSTVSLRAGEIVAIHGGELVSWWQDVLPGNSV